MLFSGLVLNAASTATRYDGCLMIDYLSLALGHGLLAVALLRLVMRDGLDVDPRLKEIAEKADKERAAGTNAGRAARRRGGGGGGGGAGARNTPDAKENGAP